MEIFIGRNLPPFLAVVLFLINAYIIRKGKVSIHDFQHLNLGIKIFGSLLLVVAFVIPMFDVMHTIFSFILTQVAYLMCYTFCLVLEIPKK